MDRGDEVKRNVSVHAYGMGQKYVMVSSHIRKGGISLISCFSHLMCHFPQLYNLGQK